MSTSPNSPIEIFLSYAREDADRAEALAHRLEADGFAVWWDVDLRGGQDFRTEIRRSIARVSHMVVLWSRDSVRSHFVIDEAGLGRESGKLIPVRIDPVEVPLGFGGLHTLEYDGSDPSYAKLRRALMPHTRPVVEAPDDEKESHTDEEPASPKVAPSGARRGLRRAISMLAVLAVIIGGGLWAASSAHQSEIDNYKTAVRQYEASLTDRKKQLRECVAQIAPADGVTRKFAENGSVRCPGGGCLFKPDSCNKRQTTFRAVAPKGYFIDSYKIVEGSMNSGKIAGSKVSKEDDQGRATQVIVALICDPPDQAGAPGGWANASIEGILRHADEAGLNAAALSRCEARLPEPEKPVRPKARNVLQWIAMRLGLA